MHATATEQEVDRMLASIRLFGVWTLLIAALMAQEPQAQVHTTFRIKYVTAGSVYLEAGRDSGLVEGMELVVPQSTSDDGAKEAALEPGILAHLRVISVASTSAVCEVIAASRPLVAGDSARLPDKEVAAIVERRTLSNTREYPAVISFSEGDPLDEEVREAVPHPPLPEINQARGRIGFDFSTIRGRGATQSASTELGMVVRADVTRMWGTHWNLNGYWRGRLESNSMPSQASIQDLINRTYQLALTYNNPDSRWIAGAGRMYLPWASSLDVIDGGYAGVQTHTGLVAGIFGGSTPDPTAWNYDPHRRIAGTFVSVQGGSFESARYNITGGFDVNMRGWQVDRPFVFSEFDLSYKRSFSLFHSMQVDRPTANPGSGPVAAGIGQSILTLRFQPHPRLSLNLTHTYFRDVPTYDSQLVGTGLLDKYLFQGVSGGARLELPRHVAVYFDLGHSNNSTDAKPSLNFLYGAGWSHIWRTGLQADARYSQFDSAFAKGSYRTFSLSRDLTDTLRLSLQVGRQSFDSPYTHDTGSRFINSYLDMNVGRHMFFENSFTAQRGTSMSYNQWTATFGYRFDNRAHRKE
jgi:hypothetical protein